MRYKLTVSYHLIGIILPYERKSLGHGVITRPATSLKHKVGRRVF